ncbi:DUF3137 domain-containing protein [Sulfurimonas sp.]
MKSVSELTDFYYKVLYPTLTKLEKDRTQLKHRIILVGLGFTSVSLFIYSLIFSATNGDTDIMTFFTIGYITLGGVIYRFLIKDYTDEFKNKVIEPMINEIDNNLSYTHKMHLSEQIFINSELFTSKPDRLNGNDYVNGKIDEIKIEFSDIHAEKRHIDSKGRESWRTIFQGLFIVSEFNKHFHGKTIVLPDTAQNTFGDLIGGWLQSNNLNRSELVKMDNPEFEKEFVVYSDDQIEARYILSHSLMQRLLSFKNKSKHPIYISFIGESIHMAIEYNKDLFEPSIFRSLLDYKIAMEYIQTLHLAIGIIDELKLNEKLWSKQ